MFINAAGHQETVCVLDALDECRDDDRKQLVDAITSASEGNLKFLLTSRPYEHICRGISIGVKSEMSSIHLQGDRGTPADDIAEEIQLVVNSRIDEVVNSFNLLRDDRKVMETRLGSVPNRTYLWITLVFDGLMEKTSGITKKYIMDLTRSLPQGVNKAYEKILAKSDDREKAKILLHLILGAKRPLSLLEIYAALVLNGQQSWDDAAKDINREHKIQDTIRSLCGLFVTVVDGKVYLLHQTAREFLVRDLSDRDNATSRHLGGPTNYDGAVTVVITQSLIFLLTVLSNVMQPILHRIWLFLTRSWQHSMDLTDSNSVLAETCISCLQLDSAKENTSMFEYSAFYWADHYRQSAKYYQVIAAKRTTELCLPPETCMQWTEVHSKHKTVPATDTPLCLAFALGLDRVVKTFLNEPCSTNFDLKGKVDSKDPKFEQTPLLWASKNGHEGIARQLIKAKANVNSQGNDKRTPLSWAAENGYQGVIRQLIEAKANVNLNGNDNRTPLLWAAKNGHEGVIGKLIEAKADVDSKGKDNRTPLSWAAAHGHDGVVKELIKAKALVDTKSAADSDKRIRTPLSWAAGNGHKDVVRRLLKAKADVNSKGNYGRTPLSWAAAKGYREVVQQLLAAEAEVNLRCNERRTPLSWAAINGHEDVVEELLQAKAQVDLKGKRTRAPLSWAAANGHTGVVKLLLKAGATIDSQTDNGQTPLSCAAANGHNGVVKELVEAEALVDSKDKYGQTPLWWATKNQHETVVRLLEPFSPSPVKPQHSSQPPISHSEYFFASMKQK